MRDLPVFHLTTPAEWAAAQASGQVRPASLTAEGFIHCSTGDQLAGTIQRHFGDADVLCLLELDLAAVGPELRWEESRPGAVYPHLYRALEITEVVRVVPWRRGDDVVAGSPPDG